MLMTSRSLRKPLLALLTLLLVLATVQIGPFATYAFADPPKERQFCPYPGATETQTLADGTQVEWICKRFFAFENNTYEYWAWEYSKTIPGSQNKLTTATRYSDSPAYIMWIQSALGNGKGGGDATGSITIFGRYGTNLDRPIAARTIMQVQYSPTSGAWYTCHDTGWQQASVARSWQTAFVPQNATPDCGNGYYRTQAAGRFYSYTTNAWITSKWHYTGSMYLAPVPNLEPTVTPGPEVTGDPA